MKNKTSNEKMANGQQSQGIQNIRAKKVQITDPGNTVPGIFRSKLQSNAGRQGRGLNIFLNQNIGKAPPGRAREPGSARGHPPAFLADRPTQKADKPENKAGPPGSDSGRQAAYLGSASPLATCREGQSPESGLGVSQQKTLFQIYNQIVNTKKTINFINILNFKIMKKQILILALFVLAAFANVNKSYGQTAIAPSPGIAYDYAVTISGAAGATAPLFTFFVTKNNDLLAGELAPEAVGTDFSVNAGGAAYNTAANVNHISLTWTVASVTTLTPFFLVAKYTELLNGCTTENTKVWQIIPVNSFILAIVPSTSTGVTLIPSDAHQCVADLVSAIMTPDMTAPLNPTVAYTYGKNTLYFKATASGMLGKWRPDLQLTSGVAGALGQIYESAQWTEDMTGALGWKTFTGAAGSTPSTTASAAFPSADTDLATILDATLGTPILIRIVVDNKNFETLADQVITAGIDGYLPAAFTQSDVVSAANLTPEVAFGKFASNSILKRPTETGTTVTFVTKAP